MNAATQQDGTFRFRLFVAGDTPNSAEAQRNLKALCGTRFCGRCEVEVIDVLRQPMLALTEGIFMTPTLVKLAPGTVQRIVGTLRNEESLLAFGLTELGA